MPASLFLKYDLYIGLQISFFQKKFLVVFLYYQYREKIFEAQMNDSSNVTVILLE